MYTYLYSSKRSIVTTKAVGPRLRNKNKLRGNSSKINNLRLKLNPASSRSKRIRTQEHFRKSQYSPDQLQRNRIIPSLSKSLQNRGQYKTDPSLGQEWKAFSVCRQKRTHVAEPSQYAFNCGHTSQLEGE